MQTGKIIPLVVALALTGLLTVAATWHRRRRLSQGVRGRLWKLHQSNEAIERRYLLKSEKAEHI
ncbi:MAG: hypothetical protein WKF84_26385 [Pyrinomonadaceae bacterium]